MCLIVGIVIITAGLGSRYEYFTLLWTRLPKVGDLTAYLVSLGAGTRYALAVASARIFADHPWAGVGLGQSGFYLLDHLPDWATDRNPEMTFLVSPLAWQFPNPKNLWLRLLAETGLVGSVLFGVFLLLIGTGMIELLRRRDPMAVSMGIFGCSTLVAILFSGASLDSFALPTMWISLGLALASLEVFLPTGSLGACAVPDWPPP
jgi:O-antigen ligase